MTAERGLMMTDWAEYERRPGVRCVVEDPWAGPVDYSDAPEKSEASGNGSKR